MDVLHLTTWQEKCGIAGYAADLIAVLNQRGIRNDVHALNRSGQLFGLAEDLRAELEQFCRRAEDYDLVHVQHEYSFFYDHTRQMHRSINAFGWLLARLWKAKKPAVVTFHTDPNFIGSLRHLLRGRQSCGEFLRGWICASSWRRKVRRFFRPGSRFFALVHTDKGRAALIGSGFDAARTRRIPIGLTPREGRVAQHGREIARQVLGYPSETVVLSLFGFISAYKGHDLAVAALRLLPPHFHLAIIGGPHPRASDDRTLNRVLKMAAKFPELRGRVRVTGFVPTETVDLYHAATDICLAPYRKIESASAGITWALTSGRPIVASSIPTFQELQGEAECLLLFTENAVHELAWHVERLAADPCLQKTLIENAAAYTERYSWARVAEEVHGVYGSLLGQSAALPGDSPRLSIRHAA
jgi:glycosyltransferase involved in cell wall biosynthesis